MSKSDSPIAYALTGATGLGLEEKFVGVEDGCDKKSDDGKCDDYRRC